MKVLLSLDERLLRQIDRAARSRHLSRSAYIAELAHRDTDREQMSVAEAFKSLDQLFANLPSEDATAAIRAERDAR
ncbi:MAG: type II toxin-antitoxin system HicB family antitoxin [Candidatus Eremiobacteraeota bacterium]|nr:type II toxin-antitoxin system HicB family antitoxin [Candidatus Eremiobacteraeota bacterium]